MFVCPKGCVDSSNAGFELEFGLDQDRKPAYICPSCDHSSSVSLYSDLALDLSAV